MRSLITAGAALLLCSTAAMAQSNPPNAPPAPSVNSSDANTSGTPETNNATPLREHIRTMLQKSGFTDIRVMPSSFMIRAKDQDGNPVVMSVSPDSITEVSEAGTSDNSNGNGSSPGLSTASSEPSEFVPVGHDDDLSSNLVGLDVYNTANQNIGQIKDIAMGPKGRTQAYILSVGGFLGMGQHYVAVNPAEVHVSYNNSDQKWHASTDLNATELKAAPAFQYSGHWNASKS